MVLIYKKIRKNLLKLMKFDESYQKERFYRNCDKIVKNEQNKKKSIPFYKKKRSH